MPSPQVFVKNLALLERESIAGEHMKRFGSTAKEQAMLLGKIMTVIKVKESELCANALKS